MLETTLSEAAYRAEVLKTGVGVETFEGVLPQLRRRLTRSLELGPNAPDVNLVAAIRPDVVEAVKLGSFVDEDGRSLLVLPADQSLLDAVRDALWIESGLPQVDTQKHERRTGRRTWAKFMGGLIIGLSWACRNRGLPLGARSTLCHQDKIVATTKPGAVFPGDLVWLWKPLEVLPVAKEKFSEHEHDAWVRIRLPIPAKVGFPDPSFLGVDFCMECAATTNAKVLLGVATLAGCQAHKHNWTDFATPIQDAKGVLGSVHGEVCLVACAEDKNAAPGRCLATRDVTFRVNREAVASVKPSWVKKDKPILRPGLKVDRDHSHLWIEGSVDLGLGASLKILRCVTCDASFWSNKIIGKTIPEFAKEIRRRIKPYGGFARTPDAILKRLREDLRPEWGEWLQRFTDAASMIVCRTGEPLREATDAELETAAGFVRRAKEESK